MSYTIKIKEEISNLDVTKSEMIAELSGFIRNNGVLHDNVLHLTTENEFTVERLKKFFQNLYEIDVEVEVKDNLNFSKKNLYQISISQKTSLVSQLKQLLIFQ